MRSWMMHYGGWLCWTQCGQCVGVCILCLYTIANPVCPNNAQKYLFKLYRSSERGEICMFNFALFSSWSSSVNETRRKHVFWLKQQAIRQELFQGYTISLLRAQICIRIWSSLFCFISATLTFDLMTVNVRISVFLVLTPYGLVRFDQRLGNNFASIRRLKVVEEWGCVYIKNFGTHLPKYRVF